MDHLHRVCVAAPERSKGCLETVITERQEPVTPGPASPLPTGTGTRSAGMARAPTPVPRGEIYGDSVWSAPSQLSVGHRAMCWGVQGNPQPCPMSKAQALAPSEWGFWECWQHWAAVASGLGHSRAGKASRVLGWQCSGTHGCQLALCCPPARALSHSVGRGCQ